MPVRGRRRSEAPAWTGKPRGGSGAPSLPDVSPRPGCAWLAGRPGCGASVAVGKERLLVSRWVVTLPEGQGTCVGRGLEASTSEGAGDWITVCPGTSSHPGPRALALYPGRPQMGGLRWPGWGTSTHFTEWGQGRPADAERLGPAGEPVGCCAPRDPALHLVWKLLTGHAEAPSVRGRHAAQPHHWGARGLTSGQRLTLNENRPKAFLFHPWHVLREVRGSRCLQADVASQQLTVPSSPRAERHARV